MSKIQTAGSRVHQSALDLAESTLQSARAAAGTDQALHRAADIQFFRSVIASSVANNGGLGAEPATTALKSFGLSA